MEIKVLGTGCMKCKRLYEEAQKAIAKSGVEGIKLDEVKKIEEITSYGVMMTPALVINGKVKCQGRVAEANEIISWITTEMNSITGTT